MPRKKKVTGDFGKNFPAGGKKPLRVPRRPVTKRPLYGGPAVTPYKGRKRRSS